MKQYDESISLLRIERELLISIIETAKDKKQCLTEEMNMHNEEILRSESKIRGLNVAINSLLAIQNRE